MITILAVTALLGSAVISRVESCNIGGFQYVPPPPPPCQPCQPDSSGKLARIFFGGVPCCDLPEDTTTSSTKALIISGGGLSDSPDQSGEVYVPSTGQHCQLADLPDGRWRHSMEKKTVCGGLYGGSTDTPTSCLTLTDAGWKFTTTLLESRNGHVSWDSPAGVILLGGYDSPRTTEKILQDGTSTASFDLKYSTSGACAINLGTSVVITGGENPIRTRVSQYSETGWVRDLPDLLQGRQDHGCSYYENNDGTQTLLVIGGWTGSGNVYLSSTELLVGTASAWVNTGELPSPRNNIRGANIDNRVFMTGGIYSDNSESDEILEFDPLTGEWKLVDKMIKARYYHAVSVINEVAGICN